MRRSRNPELLELPNYLFEKAIRFAAYAHHNQVRKGSGTPYISHPFAVAMLLQQHGFPESWVIAGLLHDTIEDTFVTLAEIHQEFGDEIAKIVEGCSEPDHHQKTWEERKKHTLEYLRTAPIAVKVVTCADKLHNLRSILIDKAVLGEEIWQRFNRSREKQEWYYRGLAKSLQKNLKPSETYSIFQEFSELVEKVFPADS